MDGLETLLPWVPPGLGALAVLAHLGIKWAKRGDSVRTDEWSRMKDLLDDLRAELDRAAANLEQVRERLAKAERIIGRYLRLHGPLPDDLLSDTHDLDAIRRQVEEEDDRE
jgi:hypothetical protein